MSFYITLNGTQIKTPTEFELSRFKLTEAGRVASGKMVMDVVARKRKFSLKYKIISGNDYNTLMAILDTNSAFYSMVYIENDVLKTATVYSGAVTGKKFRTETGAWYWKDLSFDLIEQ